MDKRLEHAEVVCNWLKNLLKQDCSHDLLGRALRDTGSKLVADWHGTIAGSVSAPHLKLEPSGEIRDLDAERERLDPNKLKIKNDRVVRRDDPYREVGMDHKFSK